VDKIQGFQSKLKFLTSAVTFINEEISLINPLTDKEVTEMRNLSTLACNIKGKWGNELKKTELRLDRKQELGSM
jgi:hypothetical protein